MLRCLKKNSPCIPDWWIRFVITHARSLLAVSLTITCVLLFFTVKNFKINTDLTKMIAEDLPFRQVVQQYHADFPELVGTILVVVEGKTPEDVSRARDLLAERLRKEKATFRYVYTPGSGTFWAKNGLLYLNDKELEQQGDTLMEMQPFLALLSQDFSLAGLFSVLKQIVTSPDISLAENTRLLQLFRELTDVIADVEQGKTKDMSWQQLMLANKKFSHNKQFILLQPELNYQTVNPAKKAVTLIRQTASSLHLEKRYGIHIGITGKPVINYEDLRSVRRDITTASIVSFILVGIILYLGLGSARLVFAGLTTLLVGLAWTIAFAILVVGRLNMISVTFVVLFIGLGIDYGIQICLRYRELLSRGLPHRDGVAEAVRSTGNTLLLCAISTAIGFYAFVPTAYVGASELGLISGTGMFFILLASVSILPAIMFLLPEKKNFTLALSFGTSIARLLIKYPLPIVVTAAVAALASMALLPKVSFDTNPFHMSDQRSEPIRVVMQLFDDEQTSPWTISITAVNRKKAEQLAARLRKLPEVRSVLTLDSFIPKNQEEKLGQIEDMGLVLPPVAQQKVNPDNGQYQRDKQALDDFIKALDKRKKNENQTPEVVTTITQLATTLHTFSKLLTVPGGNGRLLDRLNQALLPNLSLLLKRMHTLTEAEPVKIADLPAALTTRYRSKSGRYRVQVFPKHDLRNLKNLKQFVNAVTKIAPTATDQPVTVLMAGKTIVSAFRTASLLALVLIAVFLRLVMNSWREVMLVLVPLLLALCYTMAIAVLLGIPFNFANIIIVPLLLGIGVDSGIHVIQRIKELSGINTHILETSTARAVLFSSLTTIMSFGTLSFMHHAGTAGMGKLLTISVAMMIISTLLILPAYLELRICGKNNGAKHL